MPGRQEDLSRRLGPRDWPHADDKSLDELMYKAVTHAFSEDIAMTEAQQKRVERPSSDPKHVTIKADAAPIAARKIVTRMMGNEAQAAAPR